MNTKSLTLIAITGLNFLLIGCRDRGQDFIKRGIIDNWYNITISISGNGRCINIQDKNSKGYMIAKDLENDGRFDDLYLVKIPKGSPIEKYASFEKLEDEYQNIKTSKLNEQETKTEYNPIEALFNPRGSPLSK